MLARWRSFGRRSLWRRQRFEADLDEELRFHLESRTADLSRRGLSATEARRQARLELGAVRATRRRSRQARGLRLWTSWWPTCALPGAAGAGTGPGAGGGRHPHARHWPVQRAMFTLVINACLLRPQIGPEADPASLRQGVRGPRLRPGDPRTLRPARDRGSAGPAGGLPARWRTWPVRAWVDRPGWAMRAERGQGALVTCNFFAAYRPCPARLGRLLDPATAPQGAASGPEPSRSGAGCGADPGAGRPGADLPAAPLHGGGRGGRQVRRRLRARNGV